MKLETIYTVRSPEPPYAGPIFKTEQEARRYQDAHPSYVLERIDPDETRTRLPGRDA